MNNKTTRNSLLLLVTAAVWGAAFVAQTVGGQAIGAYSFNCIRSIIGALVLIPVMKFLDKKNLSPKRPKTKEDYKLLIKGGICCGVALCISTNLQQVGILMGASAGKAGFLTAVYILLVPILGLFLHKKCGMNIWFAVALALVGLYFLCMQDKNGFHPADLLLLCCAFGFSIQILFVDYFSPKVDGVRLSMIQFLVTGVLTSVPMFMVDMQHSIPGIEVWAQAFLSWSAWVPILYAGIMSCGVGYTLQIIGQNGLNPTVASLIMSLEAVFSAVFGWQILNQKLSTKEIFGCCLIFAAIILAQLPVKGKNRRKIKKIKYSGKQNLALILLFAVFLGLFADPCAINAKADQKKKDYGVFLSIDSSKMQKLYAYKLVVIDAQYFSAKEIRALHKKGVKVYTYLNVGSIEKFRDYYKKYEHLTIGSYENWEEEKWVDVSNKNWQKFIGNLSKKLLKKGVDGFFIDNCDVYDYAKTKQNFTGLEKILKNVKRLGKDVVINGGDVFVTKYRKTYGSAKDIMTAVNQECVWSSIQFKTGSFGKQTKAARGYFTDYVKKCKKDGMKVYLLEYTKDKKLIRQIKEYCKKNKFHYYISDSIELD